MINPDNLRIIADRESNFNVTIKDLKDRMVELARKGGYYIEYSDSDVHIISRLRRYFERLNFEVSQRSGTKL